MAILLFPFTLLYGRLTDLRNFFYDRGYLKSTRFEVFTLGVGNLTVGGTGKTPHVEYLIRLFKDVYRVATLSRGYGRRTRGFVLADAQATADTLGDEPMQFHRRFGGEVAVAVGEERALAIPHLLFEKPETQVILLDDAYQHRSVRPHLNLLLTDYRRPFTQDRPFPSGRLRERRPGARRADAVVVTKCPEELAGKEQLRLETAIRRYLRPGTPVFFSGVRYGEPCPFFPESTAAPLTENVVLVSGIAQPAPFEQYAANRYQVMEHCRFGDHHRYSAGDWQRIGLALQRARERSSRKVAVLTTEKDFVKLASPAFEEWTKEAACFYLPIEVHFLPNQGIKFEEWVLKAAARYAASPSEPGSGRDHRSFLG